MCCSERLSCIGNKWGYDFKAVLGHRKRSLDHKGNLAYICSHATGTRRMISDVSVKRWITAETIEASLALLSARSQARLYDRIHLPVTDTSMI